MFLRNLTQLSKRQIQEDFFLKICGLHTIHILTLTLKLNNQFHIATAQEDLGGGQHKSLVVFRAVGRSENSSNLVGFICSPWLGLG